MENKSRGSLEQVLLLVGAGHLVFALFLCLFAVLEFQNLILEIITGFVIYVLLLVPIFLRLYKKILYPLRTVSIFLNSVKVDDVNFIADMGYESGVCFQLQEEINSLCSVLVEAKDNYNVELSLIYALVEQLPVCALVFNSELGLTFANRASERWLGGPWEPRIGSSLKEAGVHQINGSWEVVDKSRQRNWQIRVSRFVNLGRTYHLVLINYIGKEVDETQREAWQQIVRVLSHEIRNTLTPIKSLTQSMLQDSSLSANHFQALDVIHNRCNSLQQFVNAYVKNSHNIMPVYTRINTGKFFQRICRLIDKIPIGLDVEDFYIRVDPHLLEQVIINLLSNAVESILKVETGVLSLTPINVRVEKFDESVRIIVRDQGIGLANTEDIFVPFYSTKVDGEGIGLFLSKSIVEAHGGTIVLSNNDLPETGVSAEIIIPV